MNVDWLSSPQGKPGNVYAEYLKSYEWDFMATITFKQRKYGLPASDGNYYQSSGSKDPIFHSQRIWNLLDQRCFVDRAFMSSEPHTTGFIHFHSLLHAYRSPFTGDGFRNAKDIERDLSAAFGFSSVSPIRSMAEVSAYCAKYVTKALEGDSRQSYDFYGQWRYL